MGESLLNRRQFVIGSSAVVMGVLGGGLLGCSSSAEKSASDAVESIDKIVFAWEPNESTATYEGMREEFAACLEKAAGVPCEIMTTTDYNVTVESLVSGKAHMASLGASEYVEAHAKNPAVNIAFVLSNDEGELDPVSYYAQICVRAADLEQYKSGDSYSIDNIAGKPFSYVSLHSTSGCVLPATVIQGRFGLESADEAKESGEFFETVLFPGSHPGSLYNLLSGESDVSVFADYLVAPFVELVSGEAATSGAIYRVKEGVDTPLDVMAGEEFAIVEAFAVPAVPICINTDAVPAEMVDAIISYMCSEEVASNTKIFPTPDDTDTVSNWSKTTDDVCFVPAEDDYYDDFRELINFDK